MRWLMLLLAASLVLALVSSWLGFGPIVLNREGEARIAFLLGDPVRVIQQPGLSLVPPFVRIQVYDARWRQLSAEPRETPTFDQERIVIDYYVVWRIADPPPSLCWTSTRPLPKDILSRSHGHRSTYTRSDRSGRSSFSSCPGR